MDWRFRLGPLAQGIRNRSGLPGRVLRTILLSHPLTQPAHILDLGCGTGRLSRELCRLGFQVSAADADSTAVTQAARRLPDADVRRVDWQQPFPFARRHFDLVLVRDLEPWRGSLFHRDAFQATAKLLDLVRPGGALILVQSPARRSRTHRDTAIGHARGCYVKHLGYFGGRIQISSLSGPWRPVADWNFWRAGAAPREYLLARFEVPWEPLPDGYWFEKGAVACERSTVVTCCPAARTEPRVNDRRRAA